MIICLYDLIIYCNNSCGINNVIIIPSQSHREGIIGAAKNRRFFMGVREKTTREIKKTRGLRKIYLSRIREILDINKRSQPAAVL